MAPMASQQDPSSCTKYRPAKPLPFELRQHCGVYFEEHLYSQALHLLLSLLSSGTIASGPAFVPPPQYLALAATLVVHPTTTTRAKNAEAQQAANLSLQLLCLTNKLVGPVAANFSTAFIFTHFSTSRHGGRRRLDGNNADADATSNVDDALSIDLAQSGSLWSRAESFWHAVGWAFNCSVLHPKRWTRWQLWLQFMCDALEDDWAQRELAPKQESTGTPRSKGRHARLSNSLIFKYIKTFSCMGDRHREILNAIFADGGGETTKKFGEIFRNELKELEKNDTNKSKKREAGVNIDEDIYGDYATASDDEDEEPSTKTVEDRPARPKRSKRSTPISKEGTDAEMLMHPSFRSAGSVVSDYALQLGDMSALILRKRLLQLLSRVSLDLPKEFMEVDSLYDLFVEYTLRLPLPIFQLMVSSPIIPGLVDAAQCTLCEKLLFEMIEDDAPGSTEPYLSQEKLEVCFLPFAAKNSSVEDNAKLSILLEALLRILASDNGLVVRPSLKEAVGDGTLARTERAQSETKKSQDKLRNEEVAWVWLLESGDRMMHMVDKLYSSGNE